MSAVKKTTLQTFDHHWTLWTLSSLLSHTETVLKKNDHLFVYMHKYVCVYLAGKNKPVIY